MKFKRIEHEDYIEECWGPGQQSDDIGGTWPVLEDEAQYGLVGNIVSCLAPDTESDFAALTLQFLVGFGNAIGRKPYFLVEGTKHYTNLFAVLAGKTAKARKGTSGDRARQLFETADQEWADNCIRSGISSGEGILSAIRDPIFVMKKGEEVCIDIGVSDKRLLLDEREYRQSLAVMCRPGNIVSTIIRDAWDGRNRIETLTKHSPTKVTDPMISIIGHITIDELREALVRTEMANGYANRFLFACVKRGQLLPFGGSTSKESINELGNQTKEALKNARTFDQMSMTEAAKEKWKDIYYALSVEQPGLLGAVTARAEAQVLRLTMIYALTDGIGSIDTQHLNAAMALWRYCEQSVKIIFGDTVGDPLADEILRALRSNFVTGMTRNDLGQLFRHTLHRSPAIGAALHRLLTLGKARFEHVKTQGRPLETWFAVEAS